MPVQCYTNRDMATSTLTTFDVLEDQATELAGQVSRVYYDSYDRKRHLLKSLYTPDSTVVWNGNCYKGQAAIHEFVMKLPSTHHEINTLDCQPIVTACNPGTDTAILVVCEGKVKLGTDRKRREFSQNFIMSSNADGKLKIVSDCFRFIDRY